MYVDFFLLSVSNSGIAVVYTYDSQVKCRPSALAVIFVCGDAGAFGAGGPVVSPAYVDPSGLEFCKLAFVPFILFVGIIRECRCKLDIETAVLCNGLLGIENVPAQGNRVKVFSYTRSECHRWRTHDKCPLAGIVFFIAEFETCV